VGHQRRGQVGECLQHRFLPLGVALSNAARREQRPGTRVARRTSRSVSTLLPPPTRQQTAVDAQVAPPTVPRSAGMAARYATPPTATARTCTVTLPRRRCGASRGSAFETLLVGS